MKRISAAEQHLASCHTCCLLVPFDSHRCPRCHASVHLRVPNSIQRTMALVVTASILYIPAMTLPIMRTVSLGTPMDSTVIGGVVVLWQMGSYPIAAVIFIASVFVPVGKLIALSVLCGYVTWGKPFTAKQQTTLYRITELVGKWSMIDVFVVSILVALIKLGDILSFYPGLAAVTFCSVVIITMIAAELFDPRLIWDKAKVMENE